jgi:hypothetical protein
VEHVALVDALVVDAHALVVDAVGRPEVFDVEGAVATDDGACLREMLPSLIARSLVLEPRPMMNWSLATG